MIKRNISKPGKCKQIFILFNSIYFLCNCKGNFCKISVLYHKHYLLLHFQTTNQQMQRKWKVNCLNKREGLCTCVYVKTSTQGWTGRGIAPTVHLDHEVLLCYMLTEWICVREACLGVTRTVRKVQLWRYPRPMENKNMQVPIQAVFCQA